MPFDRVQLSNMVGWMRRPSSDQAGCWARETREAAAAISNSCVSEMEIETNPRQRVVTALCFPGGLLKGVMLVGGMQRLEEETTLVRDLAVTSGTSSGAIIACLAALGWRSEAIARCVRRRTAPSSGGVTHTAPRTLFEETNIIGDIIAENPLELSIITVAWRLFRRRALDDGKRFFAFLGRVLASSTSHSVNPDITFDELAALTGRHLLVTASCYSTRKLVVFCPKTTPHAVVRTALLASCAYPALFLPVDIGGRVHYDGGIFCNMPLRYQDIYYPEHAQTTVAFDFDFSGEDEVRFLWEHARWPGIASIAVNIVSLLYYRIQHLEKELLELLGNGYHRRVVIIESSIAGIAASATTTDAAAAAAPAAEMARLRALVALKASKEQLRDMIQRGYETTRLWLRHRRRREGAMVAAEAAAD